MTIFLIIVVAVVGALWFYTKRSAAKEQSTEVDATEHYTWSQETPEAGDGIQSSPEIPADVVSPSPSSATPSSGGASIFTQEVNSPDIDKPFANLKSNTAGKVETEVPATEADQTEAVTEKPKRKKRKSPAKSTTTEGEAPAKPKRKYTKRKTDN